MLVSHLIVHFLIHAASVYCKVMPYRLILFNHSLASLFTLSSQTYS